MLYSCIFSLNAQAQIDLGWQQISTPELPPSIKAYKSTSTLPGGSAIKAWYTIIDLNDPNIEIDVTYPGMEGTTLTPVQEMLNSVEPVYVATNGTFYNTGTYTSVSPIVDDGEILAFGHQGITRNDTTYYATWGAWGINSDRESEVIWAWSSPADSSIFAFYEPYPNSLLEDPLPVPTLEPASDYGPDGRLIPYGVVWDAVEAMGGTPVLIKSGELVDLDAEATESCATDPNCTYCNELVNDDLAARNPRTAIGITEDRKKIILLVIDGRSVDSVGSTLKETGEILYSIGAYDGLNIDGGGSSSITVNNFDGILQAPSTGNGDNSSDVLNTPSDGYMRSVSNSILIKRRPLYFDANLDLSYYTEEGEGWFASSNSGSYPDDNSPTRLISTVDTNAEATAKAEFSLEGIVPAQYELCAYWVGAFNRASNAPITIEKTGFAPITVRLDQTADNSQFNTVGTYHLSAQDIVRLTNNADNDYVAIDALRLRYVGESIPEVGFSSSATKTAIHGQNIHQTVTINSPNSAVFPTKIHVYKSVDQGEEILFDSMDFSGTLLTESYILDYQVTEPQNSGVTFRFEVEDNLSHVVNKSMDIDVLAFSFSFEPENLQTAVEAGDTLAFNINLDTGTPDVTMTLLTVYVSRNGGERELYQEYTLSGSAETVPFSYFAGIEAGNELTFTFVGTASDGSQSETNYTLTTEPAKGDFTIGFISDMNGSYGSTSYDAGVRNSVALLVSQGVDLVISAGDMVAGQCSSDSACDEAAMWAGFNNEIYSQLKNAGIPYLFTLQNHDAGSTWDLAAAIQFWTDSGNIPQGTSLTMVDDADYPKNYSAVLDFDNDGQNDVFFVSVFNPGDDLNAQELAFLDATLQSAEAQSARLRIVTAGQPLYAVSAPRNSAGYVTGPRDEITQILRERGVDMFVSGDSAAFYPGKRFDIRLLSLAEMGGTGKAYIGESQVPPTAVTRADIFIDHPYYGKNAVVITTYDILNDFQIVRRETLPKTLIGFDNDFVIREDVPVTNTGATQLSSMNLTAPFASSASGIATLVIEDNTVTIQGSFSGLESSLLSSFDAVGLFRGRNGEQGELIQTLDVETTDGRSGTFVTSFAQTTETLDALAAGLYYLQIITAGRPEGALRGQLYNTETSNAPKAPSFTDTVSGDTVSVRNLPSLMIIEWDAAEDEEKTPITYTYQLSTSSDFSEGSLLINEYVGTATSFQGLTQAEWLAFLEGSSQRVLYQRIITSDGQTIVIGQAQQIVLTKDTDPLDGEATIATPNFEYKGVFATLGAGLTIYDIAIDEVTGRIWANTYSHGPYCFNPDGTIHKFTDPNIGYGTDANGNEFINSITFNGHTFSDGTCYGVEYDRDGYVILSVDGNLFKLDAYTGKPVAFWSTPGSTGLGANPSVADDGSIFCNGTYPGNAAYIVKASTTTQGEFDIVTDFGSSLVVSGSVARSSAYSPEGDRIYLVPTASSPYVSVYAKEGGEWIRKDNYVMPASTGSDAVYAGENQTMWVVNEKSSNPPNLIYVDFANQLTWNLFLEDIEESDIRGMTVSRDGKTVYIGGTTDIYKYQVTGEGTAQDPGLISLSRATATDDNGSAQHLGETVRVQAVVTTANLATEGLEFYGEDPSDQVKFFSGSVTDGYTPKIGDLIEVTGQVLETLGQLYILPETIEKLSQDRPLRSRSMVTEIGENLESQVVVVSGLSLTDAAQWTNHGYLGFEAKAANEDGTVFNLFISKGTDVFDGPAPEGRFTLTGVVQQKGDDFIVTPLSASDIGLEGEVTVTMMTQFLPTTSNRVTFQAKANSSLGRVKTSAFSWFRNGYQVVPENSWETATGRFYACRNLNFGDVLFAHVTTGDSLYSYTSKPFALGMAPGLVADTTDNTPDQNIVITFDENADWSAAIEKIVLVSGDQEMLISQMDDDGMLQGQEAENLAQESVELDPEQYVVNNGSIVFDAGVFDQIGLYTLLVYAENFRLNKVEQEILEASPAVEADTEDNDLINDIEISFEENEEWRKNITNVQINGVSLDPEDYTVEDGRLVIAAGVFPGTGTQTVTVKAQGYADRVFEQTIVLSTPPVLNPDTSGNFAGLAIEIKFESNPIWQNYITGVMVNESVLTSEEYTLNNGVLTIAAGVLNQVRDYIITVTADNFSDATVTQSILAAAVPGLIAVEDATIFDDISITFEDDPVWRSAVLTVLVDGEVIDAADWTLGQGSLEIASTRFPDAGDYLIQVTAGIDYQVATVTQAITSPEYAVSGSVTMNGSSLASVDIILDQLLEMTFEGELSDTSGHGYLANSDNIPVYAEDTERGQVLDLNGSSDLVNLPDVVLEGDYSVSLWLNPDLISGTQGDYSRTFMNYYKNNENAFRFAMDSGYMVASVISDGEEIGVGTSSGLLAAGQWVHVTIVVKKGKKTLIYLNGEDRTSSPYSWSRGTEAGLTIGARNRGAGHFDGRLDDLMIWNRALTAEEVSTLVSTGKGPRVVTDASGNYAAQVLYGKSLILKPVFSGVVFTPEIAGFSNIQADIVQDFTGEGELSLAVSHPVADLSVDTSADLVIDLTSVMTDPSDPAAEVAYTLVSSSDPDFVAASISGTQLTLSFKQVYGKATIEIKGTANGKEGSDSFIVELNPYCEAQGGDDWEYIFEVNLIGPNAEDLMTNASGLTHYSNYRYQSVTQLTAGQTFTLRVSGHDWNTDEVKAWIDWNQDGDFEDDSETYVVGTGEGAERLGTHLGAWSLKITVPESALPGKTLLRIRHHDAGASGANDTPCGTASYGEVEDYGLDIQTASAVSAGMTAVDSSDLSVKRRAKRIKARN